MVSLCRCVAYSGCWRRSNQPCQRGLLFFLDFTGTNLSPWDGGWLVKTGALTGARYRALYTKGRMCWAKHTIQWAVAIRFDIMREVGPLPPFSSFLRLAYPPNNVFGDQGVSERDTCMFQNYFNPRLTAMGGWLGGWWDFTWFFCGGGTLSYVYLFRLDFFFILSVYLLVVLSSFHFHFLFRCFLSFVLNFNTHTHTHTHTSAHVGTHTQVHAHTHTHAYIHAQEKRDGGSKIYTYIHEYGIMNIYKIKWNLFTCTYRERERERERERRQEREKESGGKREREREMRERDMHIDEFLINADICKHKCKLFIYIHTHTHITQTHEYIHTYIRSYINNLIVWHPKF